MAEETPSGAEAQTVCELEMYGLKPIPFTWSLYLHPQPSFSIASERHSRLASHQPHRRCTTVSRWKVCGNRSASVPDSIR